MPQLKITKQNPFMPTEWEEMKGTYGRRYTSWQLMEWSIVPVPSNPDAIRTLKSLGLAHAAGADPARVRSLLRLLGELSSKSGRVLSAANEQSLRDAVGALERVLAQLGDNDDKSFLTFEEEHVELTEEYLARNLGELLPEVVGQEVRAAINRITGRVD